MLIVRARRSCGVFSPRAVSHLMGTVEHAHQRLLVVDAREHQDHRRVGNDQVQVVFCEVEVDCLQSKCHMSGS